MNPFGDRGCIREPESFFNREEELAEMFDELCKGTSLSPVGDAQVGKSSMLAMIAAQGPRELPREATEFVSIDRQVVEGSEARARTLIKRLVILKLKSQGFFLCQLTAVHSR